MNQKAIIAIVVAFVAVVVGMFLFTYVKQQQLQQPTPVATTTDQTATAADPYAAITRIDAKHFFQNGLHTLVGEVNMPTPCDLLEATSSVSAASSTHVTIAFTVVNNAKTCEQRVTADRFKVTAVAPKDATFSATFMGRPVILNLIPPAPGETPDSFELFTKG